MNARIAACLLLLLSPKWLVASQRDAKLQVLSSLHQTVRGVGVGSASDGPSATMPCSPPFPEDANFIDTKASSSVSQCTFFFSAPATSGSADATYVKAILEASDGSSYYVYLSCWKKLGTCAQLKDNQTYGAQLSDSPKQLADSVNRRVAGAVKLYLRPDGKRKVGYTILFAVKTAPQP